MYKSHEHGNVLASFPPYQPGTTPTDRTGVRVHCMSLWRDAPSSQRAKT